jgi:hypothetical protein
MKDIEMQEPHHSATASSPHCLFCDSLNPWFSCDCETARAVQAGKYPKPKVRRIDGNTIIELHPDLLAITQKIGRFAAYEKPQDNSSSQQPSHENSSQQAVVENSSQEGDALLNAFRRRLKRKEP